MTVIGHREPLDSQRKENPKQVQRRPAARALASMLEIVLMSDLNRLRELLRRLRAREGGCPWDLEQTFNSLVPHTIEEVYEVAQAENSDELSVFTAVRSLRNHY